MADQLLISTIKIQTKSSWEWELLNPVIALGFGAYSSDTKELRIGDGEKTWTELEGSSPLLSTPPHAQIHFSNGRDPLVPSNIGAADIVHTHTPEECQSVPLVAGKVPVENIPDLDASVITTGMISENLLPALAITEVYESSSDASMILLSAQKGDVCVRTDLNKSFILSTNTPGNLQDWKELRTPTDLVLSVAGKSGAVILETADISESTNKYFVSSAEKSDWNAAKSHADSPHAPVLPNFTSDITVTTIAPHVSLVEADNSNLTRHMLLNSGRIGFTLSAGGWALSVDDVGNVIAAGDLFAYSDIRLKTDLQKIENALEKVSQINGYTFTRKDTHERYAGLIAQEVQKVLPEAVKQSEDYLTLTYGNVTSLLVEAIKELNEKLDALKQKEE